MNKLYLVSTKKHVEKLQILPEGSKVVKFNSFWKDLELAFFGRKNHPPGIIRSFPRFKNREFWIAGEIIFEGYVFHFFQRDS